MIIIVLLPSEQIKLRRRHHSHLFRCKGSTLDHYTNTNLGSVLRGKGSIKLEKQKDMQDTYFEVVNFSSNQEGEGRDKSLFEQGRHFAGRVNLGPESCSAEVVFGTKSSYGITSGGSGKNLKLSGNFDFLT